MDETFIQRLQAHQEVQGAESEHAFSRRVLVVISGHLNFQVPRDDPEIGMGWFHENYPSFPVKLETRNITIESVDKVLKSMVKSKLWEAYKEVLQMYNFENCGAVVKFKSHGLWVVHNCWRLDMTPGVTRLVHPAKSGGGTIFEPLPAFLTSVQKVWSA